MCAFLLPHALLLLPRVPILSVLAVLASLFFSYFPYLVMSSFHVLSDDDIFDVDAYRHTIEVMFTAQEILVGNADYPTEKIAENSRLFRQLGLGYANIGALLMALGISSRFPAASNVSIESISSW